MTDYFALLRQPRRPWVDSEDLKQIYHQLTRTSHPDRQPPDSNSDDSGSDFAMVNEAYRVLADPKLRLRHLLNLEGRTAIPEGSSDELMELFVQTGTLFREIDGLIEKLRVSSNTLAQSLLRSDLLEKGAQSNNLLNQLNDLYKDALEELQTLDRLWTDQSVKVVDQVEKLYIRISYLTRWMEQIVERQLQLAQ